MRSRGMTVRGRLTAASVLACALCAAATPSALASLSSSTFRTQRLCESARPRTASCVGIRLLAKSLTGEKLHADKVRQAGEEARGQTPAVQNTSPVSGGLTEEELHSAYDLPDETFPGSTQTVAIVDAYNDPTAEADLAVYDKQFGLPSCTSSNGCFKKVDQEGKTKPLPATNGEWATEISLDVDMVRAICQSCRILLVEANSAGIEALATAVEEAVKLGATEVSNSYSSAEESWVTTADAYYNHPGVAITVSTGDCGYLDEACGSSSPNFPADSPYVVAVGGTHLSESGSTWTSTVWEDGGSGCSKELTAPTWQSSLEEFSKADCSGERSSADVSAVADPYTGVDVYDSTPAGNGDPTGWVVLGGTSASSPIMAAEFGLAGGSHGVSYPAKTLYENLGDSKVLTDVTSGHNGTCSSIACKAASGYDGPTGVGSPYGLGAFFPAGSPLSSDAPTISGTDEQGQTLTVSHGTWSGSPTSYSEQWLSCNESGGECSEISGATAGSYTLTSKTLVGHTIRVQETATDTTGAGPADISSATGKVISDTPVISSFTPTSGVTGSTIKITGTAFTGATKVTIDRLTASFKLLSSTEVEATVPSGAQSGTIVVTTPYGSGTSSKAFAPTLSLVSVSPAKAIANTTVTLTGIGFTSSSEVFFDGTRATATYVSSTKIKAVVPVEGSSGAITVVNTASPAGTVSSPSSFTLLE